MTYHIYPNSKKNTHWVFAFYGFGQQANVFDYLAESCSDTCGFMVFDLPYQACKTPQTKIAFIEEMKALMHTHQIESITGISYSIGSRYNLVLAELLSPYLKKIILIAPDGVANNIWNKIATSTIFGHQIFKYLMFHPQTYLVLLKVLNKLFLLPRNLYLFTKLHVRNKETATRVYNCWMNMKHMQPDLQKINLEQQKYSFPIIGIFGKYDFVIKQKSSTILKKEIPAAELKIVEKGHKLLDEELFDDIATYL
jgi:pimeloyl-ACP methyl ester carboxylesterase